MEPRFRRVQSFVSQGLITRSDELMDLWMLRIHEDVARKRRERKRRGLPPALRKSVSRSTQVDVRASCASPESASTRD